MKKIPSVIAFVGESGSGKTSLLVETAPHLSRVGLRVAALKHTSGDFETSSPAGKDTARYAAAAIPSIGIISDSKFAFSRVHASPPPSPADIAAMYFRDADIVLAEGFKKEAVPKILLGAAPSDLNSVSTLWSFPAINAVGGNFHAKTGAPEYARTAAAVIFMFYAALRRHVFVGVGNRLKGDDAFGPLAADGFRAAGFTTIDAGVAPENMANKILASDPEVIIVFDALSSPDARAGFFGLYAPDETRLSAQMSTHGGGIGMFLEYLKMNSRARIAVVGASGESFSLGSEVSPAALSAVRDIFDCAVRIKKCTS